MPQILYAVKDRLTGECVGELYYTRTWANVKAAQRECNQLNRRARFHHQGDRWFVVEIDLDNMTIGEYTTE